MLWTFWLPVQEPNGIVYSVHLASFSCSPFALRVTREAYEAFSCCCILTLTLQLYKRWLACAGLLSAAKSPFLLPLREEKATWHSPFSGPEFSLFFPLQKFLHWLVSSGQAYSLVFFFFFPLCCSSPPLLSLHTRALMHTHARTHTEENLYVSDIQQGKDKGTELITHHLLLLRRTDGSRRYVNGKGQWIIRFF